MSASENVSNVGSGDAGPPNPAVTGSASALDILTTVLRDSYGVDVDTGRIHHVLQALVTAHMNQLPVG